MPITTIADRQVAVDDEGFMTDASQWDESLARSLADQIGLQLTEDHLAAIRFLRKDFAAHGETATLRRIAVVGGISTKRMFELFPSKPAKKLAYVSGLPKPRGCV